MGRRRACMLTRARGWNQHAGPLKIEDIYLSFVGVGKDPRQTGFILDTA